MRTPTLLLLWLAAACNPPGLTLEVVIKDPSITSVELFVGVKCMADCPHEVVAPNLLSKRVSAVFLIEDPRPWPAEIEAQRDRRVAGFRIEVDSDQKVPIVVAVGFDAMGDVVATKTFHEVPVSARKTSYWQVELVTTEPIRDNLTIDPPEANEERVAAWHVPSKKLPSCLLLEHWNDVLQPERELVVPKDDPDCDDLPTDPIECAPWTHLATAAPTGIDNASCLVIDQMTCKLGGRTCSEVAGVPSNACAPLDEDYCTPLSLCGCTLPWDRTCVNERIMNGITSQSIPHLYCGIPVDGAGNLCGGTPTRIAAVSALPIFTTWSSGCTAIRLHGLDVPLGPFQPSVAIGGGTLAIENFASPCQADFVWSGSTNTYLETVFVELELASSKHLVVPGVIELQHNSCGTAPRCFFTDGITATNDGFYQCMTSSTGSCVPSGSCVAGPPCNGICCGVGERCANGICVCGDGPECTDGDRCTTTAPTPDQCGMLCSS